MVDGTNSYVNMHAQLVTGKHHAVTAYGYIVVHMYMYLPGQAQYYGHICTYKTHVSKIGKS